MKYTPKALTIDCPNVGRTMIGNVVCGGRVGSFCNGLGVGADLCQARLNAAVAVTRNRNRELRKGAGK